MFYLKKNNKKKRNSKIILIVIISIMVLLIGSTLAYLIVTNKGNDKDYITMDNIDIEYVDGESIRNNDLQIPMNEDEVLKYAPKHEFSVRNNNNKEVYLRFKLTNLNIDKEIYSDSNLRYSLYHNDDKIGGGSFEAYDEKTKELILLTNIKQNASSEENYQLYIWIRDNGGNQNHFLNMNLDGKIKVEGYDKELPTLASAILGKNNKNVITETPDFSKVAVSQEYYDTLPESGITSDDTTKVNAVVENGLYSDFDDDGETYYYRGHIENNYVKIPGLKWTNDDEYHKKGEDMLFRIVRINGDGTIRIIADSSIGKSEFNKEYNEEKYVGYTYDNNKTCTKNSICNGSEGTPSTIKSFLDEWYQNNIKGKYNSLFSTSRYCNDTSIYYEENNIINYGTHDRIYSKKYPTFICPNTNKLYGGEYNLKIGLLSADEAVFAGGKYATYNNNYYLSSSNSSRWLGSPLLFNGARARGLFIRETTSISNDNLDRIYAVVPVFNLKFNIMFISGNGTKNLPYIIKIN